MHELGTLPVGSLEPNSKVYAGPTKIHLVLCTRSLVSSVGGGRMQPGEPLRKNDESKQQGVDENIDIRFEY